MEDAHAGDRFHRAASPESPCLGRSWPLLMPGKAAAISPGSPISPPMPRTAGPSIARAFHSPVLPMEDDAVGVALLRSTSGPAISVDYTEDFSLEL